MTSSSESRREARRLQRRESSPRRSPSRRRPRLLRVAATEPLITTSNASRNSLAHSQSSRRATDLLSRVAFVSGSPPSEAVMRSSSPMPTRHSTYDHIQHRQGNMSTSPASSPESYDEFHQHAYSGRYFSFPSFDIYEEGQQEEDKEATNQAS